MPQVTRRTVLAAAVVAPLAGCTRDDAPPVAVWVGARHDRGHRLRDRGGTLPAPAVQRSAAVIVIGGGIAGLAAARACLRRGIDDVRVLELEDDAGGNSRGHVIAGMACPLGAHYLPLPGPQAHEVAEWLHELGLLKTALGRTEPEERHLCHSPQERLFFEGAWHEGLLPPAEPGSATLAQYRRCAQAVAQAQKLGFALPSRRAPWTGEHRALDALSFAAWLDAQGLDDPKLRWYLDYCCRDDYGAGTATVSAWAGLHYFASRHGFHAPGDAEAERDPVYTWPEGNAWLARRLAAPLGDRLHTGRTVLRVDEGRHGVDVLAWDEAAQRAERWTAQTVVMAVPLFIAARVLATAPAALPAALAQMQYAPWLVANVHVEQPLLDRPGAPPSWDNVPYGSAGLGYVDAMHQSLRAATGATVLTFYRTLPVAERVRLLSGTADDWARVVLGDAAAVHPDLPRRARRIELMRWGHAMAIPVPGVRGSAAIAAMAALRGRVRFAHADLGGTSVFEEAFTAGTAVMA